MKIVEMALFLQCLEINSQRLFLSRTLVNKTFLSLDRRSVRNLMKLALIATEKLPVPPIRGGAIQIYLDSVAKIIGKLEKEGCQCDKLIVRLEEN